MWPPSALPQRAGTEEEPISLYPSGQEPQTAMRFMVPNGTHSTRVGSPSLQMPGALVTPVFA